MPETLPLIVFASAFPGLVIGLGAGLWAFLLGREILRRGKSRLGLRIVLATLAVGSLTMAGLKPVREVPRSRESAILLTPGTTRPLLEKWRDSLQAGAVLTLDSSLAREFPDARLLPDLAYAGRIAPQWRDWHILGSGLEKEDLAQLQARSLFFHPALAEGGFSELRYSPALRSGDSLLLEGMYRREGSGRISVFLESPQQRSLIFHADSSVNLFHHTERPRKEGQFLFHLSEEDEEGRVLRRRALPLVVFPARRMRVAILEAAPSFETRYLKNWLADEGYAIRATYQISQDRSITEFFNQPRTNTPLFSAPSLEETDLLILSGQALAQRSPAERRRLRQAVEEGLGVLILPGNEWPDLPSADRAFFLGFPMRSGPDRFQLRAGTELELEKAPFALLAGPGVVPLLRSRTGAVIAATQARGKGRVGVQLAGATYRLRLAAEDETYVNLWNPILEGIARSLGPVSGWSVMEPLQARVHAPVDIALERPTAAPEGELLSPDGQKSPFYLRQDALLPGRWQGRVWPRTSGWHQLSLSGQDTDTLSFYVFDRAEWEDLERASARKATLAHISTRKGLPEKAPEEMTALRPVSLLIFYIGFLLSAGGLWLEERL